MKVQFYLRYATQFGESFSLCLPNGQKMPLEYLSDKLWHASLEADPSEYPEGLAYAYEFHRADGLSLPEFDPQRRLDLGKQKGGIEVYDYFSALGQLENVFATQPFRLGKKAVLSAQTTRKKSFTHVFRTKAPLLAENQAVCLLGHGNTLRNWDTAAPILLKYDGTWWETSLDLSAEEMPLGYKYGVWDENANRFLGFEEGDNRPIYASRQPVTVFHDNFARLPFSPWKGAGVAIPVFSLRSQKSWGVGEFADLPLLADWAKSVGLKLLQLLPVNDTSATGTWKDSYPYAAISAFALHPLYINVEQVAGPAHAAVLKPYAKRRKSLNALEAVDYEAVMSLKWEVLRKLYDLQKKDWATNADYRAYFEQNKHWLAPYAVFCWLRDLNGTSDFGQWGKHARFDGKAVQQVLEAVRSRGKGKAAPEALDSIGLHLFVQWHLHLQLRSAAEHAHALGLALKGDIPIGIYRYSCDAWVAPELYNMDAQAGAPPDDFAEKGQNWGFPTYNWERMKADGFAWWKQRFEQMSLYFDAFRIDHILGFFRIWSIPMHAVEGILGQFVPALPVTEEEFRAAGIGFDYDRLCKPYIDDNILQDIFGSNARQVAERFLDRHPDGRYDFKPEFDTQRKVKAWMKAQPPNDFVGQVRDGLYALLSDVICLPGLTPGLTPGPSPEERGAATPLSSGEGPGVRPGVRLSFRFNMEKTHSFQQLPDGVKAPLKALYVNYFYRRQDDFWKREALEKLPALKAATQMLICGEDLGMVPACVPEVMQTLGILSLEIQRMPKAAGATFFHPRDAPYLSVVTPSTHDMSTIRGWWEEDRSLTQRFFNEVLQRPGPAPYFCEDWANRAILEQHFRSPAMWAIFQLQDLLGMDAALRRENPNEERINVPANPKHYWRYRSHIAMEELMQAEGFNTALRALVAESGRG